MRRASEPTDAGPTAALRSSRTVTFGESPRAADLARGNRYRVPSDSGRDDPSSLLKDFDSKLQSIHEVLSRYQTERTSQARGITAAAGGGAGAAAAGGGPGGGSGADHPHHAHGAGGHDRSSAGQGSGSSSARRWQPSQHSKGHEGPHPHPHPTKRTLDPGAIMDEEVFVRHVLATPRRIKSAVPGASRALSARIEYYRAHRDKAQEKAERAREEQLAALREMTNGVVGGLVGSTYNFIEANRRSIVPNALAPSLQMTIDTIRDQGLANLASCTRRGRAGTATGSGTGTESARSSRPWSGMPPPPSVRGAVAPYSLGASPALTPAAAAGAAGGGFYISRTVGISTTGAEWLQPASEPEWEAAAAAAAAAGGVQRSGGSGSAGGPGSRRPTLVSRHASLSWDGGSDGDGGPPPGASGQSSPSVFLTSLEALAAKGGSTAAAGAMSPVSTPGAGGGGGGGGGAASADDSPTGSRGRSPPGGGGGGARPSSQSVALPPRPSTAATTSQAAPAGSSAGRSLSVYVPIAAARASTNSPGGLGLGGGGPPSVSGTGTVDGSLSYGAGANVDMRRLRLALSARPASGGSPTRRMDYIAEQAARRVEKALYAAEVRERAAAIDAERRRNIVAAAEMRAAQRREEEARQVQARVAAERQERQRQWTGIVGLCSKLSFLAERIMEDRRVRAFRAMRKEAAVKIATWYKGILLRRRQVELVYLIQRLRHLLRPYLDTQKVLVRQRCAARLVDFLQYTQTSNMAVVGVRRLKAEVEVLQTAWRNALLVRGVQRQILYNQLTRLEREVVTTNKRAERTLQGQLMRLGKSVNILEPDGALLPTGFTSGRSFRVLGGTSFRGGGGVGAAVGAGGGGGGGGGAATQQAQGHGHDGTPPTPGAGAGAGAGTAPAGADGGLTARGMASVRAQYDRLRQPGRGVLLHDLGVEEDDELLRAHVEMVPREVREQVVSAFLIDARREHRKLLEQYSNEKMLYQARKPIEEMRQKMLRDAGLTVEPEVKPPVMPHMRLVYPRPKLRELLRRAVEINAARLAAAEERRQQEAAEMGRTNHWLSGDRHGGGVLWADQAGGGGGGGGGAGGDRSLAAIHGSVSRGALARRSPSRASLRATSHKNIRMPPPS